MCPARPPPVGSTAGAKNRTLCSGTSRLWRSHPSYAFSPVDILCPPSVSCAASTACDRILVQYPPMSTFPYPGNTDPSQPRAAARVYPASCISDYPHIRVNVWIDQHCPRGIFSLTLSPHLCLILWQKNLRPIWCCSSPMLLHRGQQLPCPQVPESVYSEIMNC